MTDEQLNKFKQNVYEPYTQAWVLMKELRDTEPKDDKFWEDYKQKCCSFPEKYGNSEIAQSLSRVLLDVGSEVGRIVR